ncbi:MAG: glycosyltransferase family 2 protein [Lachnospiraceae bacterium]|nr:glycosyltransferase family 2 protein [Lachnospiraceae bacterium]
MKILSVAIPCYNSEAYMERAIKSLLPGGEDLEIIIVNDGSKDNTQKIAEEYEKKYPTIVRVVNQENGGHGEAVNAGLRHAKGLYYKVVDSDDWVEEQALYKIIDKLKEFVESGEMIDMLISNYVYEKLELKKQKVIDYRSCLPVDKIFGWSEIGKFKSSQNILMHSVIYRTKMLRECGLQLPKHTFYVDNIFVYVPLPFVKKLYYMDVDFYRYYIGREDQSVNETVMMGRIDQQIRVTKIMIDSHDLTKVKCKQLRKYMVKYLVMMMTVSSVFLVKLNTEESIAKREELWNYLKKKNERLYREMNRYLLGWMMQRKNRTGRKIIVIGYHISKKIFGFN